MIRFTIKEVEEHGGSDVLLSGSFALGVVHANVGQKLLICYPFNSLSAKSILAGEKLVATYSIST
jgi:hypothetical protein